jgi:hypothetical protein
MLNAEKKMQGEWWSGRWSVVSGQWSVVSGSTRGGGGFVCSRGAATDGSQGWSEQRERNPWKAAPKHRSPGRATETDTSCRFLSPFQGSSGFRLRSRGCDWTVAGAPPRLPSVAAPRLHTLHPMRFEPLTTHH